MKRHLSTAAAAAVVCVLSSAQPVRADWLLTPYAGVTFGGDPQQKKLTYGGSIGWMGAGVMGFEFDAGIVPKYFDVDAGATRGIGDSNVSTVMANLILGAPLGRPGLRPYASAGAGIMRLRAKSLDNIFDLNDSSFGLNVGGGVMAFIGNNVALRGDVRYFRNLQDSNAGNDINIDVGNFHFWRGTAGVTFRF